MPKYIVEYKEVITHILEVEAIDQEEAKEIASGMYYDISVHHNIQSGNDNVEHPDNWKVREITPKCSLCNGR